MAAFLLLPSIALTLLPKFQSEKADMAVEKVSGKPNATTVEKWTCAGILIEEAKGTFGSPSHQNFGHSPLSALKKSLTKQIRSLVYLSCIFGNIFDNLASKGFRVFEPKYLQNDYGLTQSLSSLSMSMCSAHYTGAVVSLCYPTFRHKRRGFRCWRSSWQHNPRKKLGWKVGRLLPLSSRVPQSP